MIDQKLRHEAAWRGEGFENKLAAALVTVCGAGALGSHLVDRLARSGCKRLRVIDFDRVSEANLGTQVWNLSEVGALKAVALKSKMFNTTGVEIEAVSKELNTGNVAKNLRGSDVVIDCFDNAESREIVQSFCLDKGMACIHAGMSGDGFAEVTWKHDYRVPKGSSGDDPCDVPLAGTLVGLAVNVLAEEVLDFLLAERPRIKSWTITLRDLQIRERT